MRSLDKMTYDQRIKLINQWALHDPLPKVDPSATMLAGIIEKARLLGVSWGEVSHGQTPRAIMQSAVSTAGGKAAQALYKDYKNGVELPPEKEAAAERILKGKQEGAHITNNGGAAYKDYLAAVDDGADSAVITEKKRKATEAVEQTQQKRNAANVGKHSDAMTTGGFVSEQRVKIKLQVKGEVVRLKRDIFSVGKRKGVVVELHNALSYVNCPPEVRDGIKGKVQGVVTNSDFLRMFDGGRTDRKLDRIKLRKIDGQHGVQITPVELC